MLVTPGSQSTMLQELKDKRKRLQERFEDNPNETFLALELKIIDDQIAECKQQVQHKSSISSSSAALTRRKFS
jgi:hypothetical protein